MRIQYYIVLIQNGFDDLEIVKHLAQDDLIKIGIDKLGHQNKLLKCDNQINDTVFPSTQNDI